MNKITTLGIAALGLMGFACSVDMEQPQEEVASNGDAISCTNDQATFSVLAGMAVAAANEMKRWLPQRDFECNADMQSDVGTDTNGDGLVDQPGKCIRMDNGAKNGYVAWNMGLSNKAWPRCPNRNCRNMAYLLTLQEDSHNGEVHGGQFLNAGVLRSRLKSYWDRQFTCINRVDNHTGDDCPVEYHDLTFWYKTQSSVTCNGGFDFWYHSKKQGSNPAVPLQYPAQLHNMLIWAGGSDNPFLMFNNVNGDVKIDPTGGTVAGSSVTSGSCYVVSYSYTSTGALRCGQVVTDPGTDPVTGQLVDPYWNVAGKCCSCNGQNKTLQSSSQLGVFKCQ